MPSIRKNLHSKNSICFVAGKSAGHILPCLTLAQQFLRRAPDYSMIFFSTQAKLDHLLLANNPLVSRHIALAMPNLQIKKIYLFPVFIAQFMRAFLVSFYHLYKLKPESIISSGGAVAIPVCVAAKLLGIPIELYELNVVPGKTVKFLAPLAYKIWVCFKKTTSYLPAHKCSLTEYPIKFSSIKNMPTQAQALNFLGLSTDKKTIVVLGGSQGSVFINNCIKTIIAENQLDKNGIQIIHQTGTQDTTNWQEFYAHHAITAIVFDYLHELEPYYCAADLIICRSGAGTLAEISFFNKKCITIPLEADTTLHQVDNALAVAEQKPHLFTVLRQKDIQEHPDNLAAAVTQLLQ